MIAAKTPERFREASLKAFQLGLAAAAAASESRSRGLNLKTQIPLNPPLPKGDFENPPSKKGGRGDLAFQGVRRG